MSHCKLVSATSFLEAKCSKMDRFLPKGGDVWEETGESNFPVSSQRTTSGPSLFQKHPLRARHWSLTDINSVLRSAGGKEQQQQQNTTPPFALAYNWGQW